MRVSIVIQALALGLLFLGQAFAAPDLRLDQGRAGDSEQNGREPAIEGYSPVSYFDEGKPERGSPEFTSTHEGELYYFTSAQQKRQFDMNPDAYAPTFPHNCPYNLAKGREVAIDPTNFKIVNGELLLFHKSPEQDGLVRWNKETSKEGVTEAQLMEKAQNNLLDLEF